MVLRPRIFLRKQASQIVEAATRARDLVHQLLAYSRKQILQMKAVQINHLLRQFKPLLQRTIRENIHIDFKLNNDIPAINADANQIEQIVMNLAVNAQDALPGGGGHYYRDNPGGLPERNRRCPAV